MIVEQSLKLANWVLSQAPSNSKACEKHNSHHAVLLTSVLCLGEIPELVHNE